MIFLQVYKEVREMATAASCRFDAQGAYSCNANHAGGGAAVGREAFESCDVKCKALESQSERWKCERACGGCHYKCTAQVCRGMRGDSLVNCLASCKCGMPVI